MDLVPIEFRERVAALWKCCALNCDYIDRCPWSNVPDCDWTQKSEKILIWFFIGEENGEWKHYFTTPDGAKAQQSLSMDELKNHPKLKNVVIGRITVLEKSGEQINEHLWSLAAMKREDMESLMKFVVFLSNEPWLGVTTTIVDSFHSPEGAILLNHLSTMTFSFVSISQYYFPAFDRLVENQFSRRIPTSITVRDIGQSGEFFREHLEEGNITRFCELSQFRFTYEVIESIINNVVGDVANYQKGHFEIFATFDESTKRYLQDQLTDGRCTMDEEGNFCFKAFNAKLEQFQNLCIKLEAFLGGRVRMVVR